MQPSCEQKSAEQQKIMTALLAWAIVAGVCAAVANVLAASLL
jgi:hypothetical protein